ncbi:HEPN domain-containing protein [Micromonospora sp. NPDC050276]|uniref:HEPN domain-containing protein n=1 Tax=Micromonospora sp. NPDC050276 TaxID=3364278 RepID=UPI0037B8E09B
MAKANHWPPRNLYGLKLQLDALADAVGERPRHRTDDEQVWLTRFLVVRTCGYLEQVVYEAAREHVRQKSGGRVRTLALSWIERTRNPTPENLLDLISRFGDDFFNELESILDEDDKRLRRELKLLVDRRNKIAHGLNEGMTQTKALSLKRDVEAIADWVLANLKPN